MSLRLNIDALTAADEATLRSAGDTREKPWNRQMPDPTFDSKGSELVYHHFANGGSVDLSFTIDHGKAIVMGTGYKSRPKP
jgi:hypothetical protein